MRLVQFEVPVAGRRVGIVCDDVVLDVTAVEPELKRVYDVFQRARREKRPLNELLFTLSETPGVPTFTCKELLAAAPDSGAPFLHPPLDHSDPYRVLVTGTGLTHTGGMQSRDQMHADVEQPQTDSAKMFEMGLRGGKPPAGERGAAPEWFYKGNGNSLRGHRAELAIPAFALDGGEEPEIVGCYIVDEAGVPRRLGFALGNEWSDHATEKINYLYLAPSKLRTCAIGPELRTDVEFTRIELNCRVRRNGDVIYDSGELYSGEEFMCHSLANCEGHHFKFPAHRRPGDVHLHFFGTSKLSYSTREWEYQTGDEVTIESPQLGAALVNPVRRCDDEADGPVRVEPA